MRLHRTIKTQSRGVQLLNDLHSRAEHFKITSKEINEGFQDVLYKHLPKDTPQWVKCYLRGYHEHWNNGLYHNKLEFCYLIRGKLYSINRDSDRWYEVKFTPKELYELAEDKGHFWKDTDKRYF